MLGVGTDTANRALQLLSQRGVFVRKQRKGTFVANGERHSSDSPIRRVHLVMPPELLKKEGFFADGHVLGIQSELPQAEIVFNLLPTQNHEGFIQNLVHEAVAMSGVHAFILASSSFVTQKIMAGSGLPTVVGGSLYPSIKNLHWIDDDHELEARLTAEYLLGRGCKKFLLLGRERTLPGEQIFMDALSRELGAAGIGFGDVIMRTLPNELDEVAANVFDIFENFSGMLGVMTRTKLFSKSVEDVVERRKMKFGRDLEMVASNLHPFVPRENIRYPFIRAKCNPEQRGKRFGVLLKKFINKETVENCVFPVELVRPK